MSKSGDVRQARSGHPAGRLSLDGLRLVQQINPDNHARDRIMTGVVLTDAGRAAAEAEEAEIERRRPP